MVDLTPSLTRSPPLGKLLSPPGLHLSRRPSQVVATHHPEISLGDPGGNAASEALPKVSPAAAR